MTKRSCFDEIKDFLCRVIRQRKHLITIFKFDSERHRGNLEDAILEALFNGLYGMISYSYLIDDHSSGKIHRRNTQSISRIEISNGMLS